MKPSKAIVSIVSLIASGSLGVDAMVFDDTVLIPKQDIIANERVEVKQVENIVEARAPWKGEPGINIKYDMGEPTFTDRIKDRRKKEAIYETVDFGDGGFKVDILLTEKPDTNRFCYTIEGAENYDFFYQPPLTEQEKAEGSSRPPEIEGSYAVYHKTLKNHVLGQENYATGKVMHIPRPQVWELGNEEATKQWADLSYENGQLCVTAPQDFLDNADYTNGVRIDPTFGYSTCGATNGFNYGTNPSTSNRIGRGFTLGDSASVTEINVCAGKTVTESALTMSAFINTENAAADSHTQVAETERTNMTIDVNYQFYSFPLVGTYTIPSGDYILSALANGESITTASADVRSRYDTGASGNEYLESTTGAGGYATRRDEDPWTEVESAQTRVLSIYATYTTIPQTTTRINNGTIRINNGTLDL